MALRYQRVQGPLWCDPLFQAGHPGHSVDEHDAAAEAVLGALERRIQLARMRATLGRRDVTLLPWELKDRHGEPHQLRGGRVKYQEVKRLVEDGAPIIELTVERPRWINDPVRWWRELFRQVETKDHPAAGPWPEHAAYVASVWFSSAGRVVVVDVQC